MMDSKLLNKLFVSFFSNSVATFLSDHGPDRAAVKSELITLISETSQN